MEHVSAEGLAWKPAGDEHFTGIALFGPMHAPAVDEDINLLGVAFQPAARTDWHTHPGGQVLYVVSGAGRVGVHQGAVIDIGPGDSVFAPPGQRHWHGAAPNSPMTHLSITTGGPTAWDDAKVTDAEYEANG